jgi:hypothetical protein
MKNDGNCEHYKILSQTISTLYGWDVLNPESEIPDEVKLMVTLLKKKVLKYYEIHLNNKKMFNFIQHLANLY